LHLLPLCHSRWAVACYSSFRPFRNLIQPDAVFNGWAVYCDGEFVGRGGGWDQLVLPELGYGQGNGLIDRFGLNVSSMGVT
jgi:hypothetical protein